MAAGTAVNALFFGPQPFEKGMTVLTQGTGGVSAIAIQVWGAFLQHPVASCIDVAKLMKVHSWPQRPGPL